MDHRVSGEIQLELFGAPKDLIVTDGKTEVTKFKEIIEDDSIKKIVVNISGGTDSPLVVYFMAKSISITQSYDKEIYPHFMLDREKTIIQAPSLVPKQLDVIRGLFPDVMIHDLMIQEYHNEGWDLKIYRRKKQAQTQKMTQNLIESINPDIILAGGMTNLPSTLLKLYGHETNSEGNIINAGKQLSIDEIPESKKNNNPWHKVNKKFIAHQYQKEGLMENLYPLTESCLIQSKDELISQGLPPDAFPCKVCHQCIEKFIAFGMYDRCVTK